jgi:hypothetical protein
MTADASFTWRLPHPTAERTAHPLLQVPPRDNRRFLTYSHYSFIPPDTVDRLSHGGSQFVFDVEYLAYWVAIQTATPARRFTEPTP